MNVICLQDEAFYQLVEEVIDRMQLKQSHKEDKWVSLNDAMQFLGVKSKSTMQKLRDEGKVRFTQPQQRIILYDKESLNDYLEQSAQNTF